MTPKEKLYSLMTKYRTIIRKTNVVSEDEIYLSKQFAIIAVDEILSVMNSLFTESYLDSLDENKYWQKVKEEIEKL